MSAHVCILMCNAGNTHRRVLMFDCACLGTVQRVSPVASCWLSPCGLREPLANEHCLRYDAFCPQVVQSNASKYLEDAQKYADMYDVLHEQMLNEHENFDDYGRCKATVACVAASHTVFVGSCTAVCMHCVVCHVTQLQTT